MLHSYSKKLDDVKVAISTYYAGVLFIIMSVVFTSYPAGMVQRRQRKKRHDDKSFQM